MKNETVVSVTTYILVWAGLLVLTLGTTGIAYIDLGARWNLVVAMAIAVVKTLLVALFFMHLRYSDRRLWVFAGAGVFWLMIMLSLTMADPVTRVWLSSHPG